MSLCRNLCFLLIYSAFLIACFRADNKNEEKNYAKDDYVMDYAKMEHDTDVGDQDYDSLSSRRLQYVKFFLKPVDWNTAWQTCRDQEVYSETGKRLKAWLGVPLSKKMLDHLVYLLKSYVPCGIIHTGIHSTHTKINKFHSMSSFLQKYYFLEWRIRDTTVGTCPLITNDNVAALRSNGFLDVVNKNEKYSFFCTVSTDVPLRRLQCNGDGYEYESGNCYKFHKEKKTWDEASEICNSEGAYLAAEITSQSWFKGKKEADYLFGLYLRHTNYKEIKGDNPPTAFIGHRNWGTKKNKFNTIFGYYYIAKTHDFCETPEDNIVRDCGTIVGYYPRNNKEGAITGCQPCDSKLPFICKKKANDRGKLRNKNKLQKQAIIDRTMQWDTKDYINQYHGTKGGLYLKIFRTPKDWLSAWKTCRNERLIAQKEEGNINVYPWLTALTEQHLYLIKRYVPGGIIHSNLHNSYTAINEFHGSGKYARNYTTWKWRLSDESCPCMPASRENVVVLRSDGTLDVAKKQDKYPFICSLVLHNSQRLIFPQCSGEDYKFESGSCYKFHKEIKSWKDASDICNSEDAYLAVVDDKSTSTFKGKSEADFLFELYLNKTKQNKGIKKDDNPPTVFIGHINWNLSTEHTWFSIFGSNIGAKPTAVCNEVFPNGAARDCGTIIGNYNANNPKNKDYAALTGCQPCQRALPFICEKKGYEFGKKVDIAKLNLVDDSVQDMDMGMFEYEN